MRPSSQNPEHSDFTLSGFFTKTSAKSRSNRRNTIKSNTKEQVEGKFHKVKVKIKEIAGKVSMNPELENEGKDEN